MKTIELPALRIRLNVGDNIHYQNDGLVEDIWGHTINLNKKAIEGAIQRGYQTDLSPYMDVPANKIDPIMRRASKLIELSKPPAIFRSGCKSWRYKNEEHSWPEAMHQGIGEFYIHTFVEAGMDPEETLFANGHQQTRALIKLGRLNSLEYALNQRGKDGYSLNLMSTESICDIGGIQALLLSGAKGIEIGKYLKTSKDPQEAFNWLKRNMRLLQK